MRKFVLLALFPMIKTSSKNYDAKCIEIPGLEGKNLKTATFLLLNNYLKVYNVKHLTINFKITIFHQNKTI